LKKKFDEEAWKYNVYPLYDDLAFRLANVTAAFTLHQKKYLPITLRGQSL
jgi:hypothetical protein